MFDFSLLKKSIHDLSGGITAKLAEIESLKQRRDALAKAPGTRECVLALITKQVDDAGACYAKRLQLSIAWHMEYGIGCKIGTNGRPKPVTVATARDHLNAAPTPLDVEASLCFLMGSQMKAALAQAINAMDWPANAEPVKGRAERVAKLDKQIAELEADVKTLREEAAKAGILV